MTDASIIALFSAVSGDFPLKPFSQPLALLTVASVPISAY
jgi:hypothetical protein